MEGRGRGAQSLKARASDQSPCRLADPKKSNKMIASNLTSARAADTAAVLGELMWTYVLEIGFVLGPAVT